jgi:hypothetical protein
MEPVPPTIAITGRPPSKIWESNFLLLVQFRDREGHLRVPSRHVEDGKRLGNWIRMNRAQQKDGTLDSERLRRLNEIGFIWEAQAVSLPTIWTAQRAKSVSPPRIITTPGGMSLNLPPRSSMSTAPNPYYYNLSRHPCPSQANHWDLNSLLLSSLTERVLPPTSILTAPGGMRSLNLLRLPCPPPADLWDFNFLLLLQFRDREGHLRVPKRHVEAGQNLGDWICKQRTKKRKEKLDPEKERRLNEIFGFIWDAHGGRSVAMITALTQFKQREGHCNVSANHTEALNDGVNLKLGIWVRNQRQQKMLGTLDAKREKLLESLGVKWNCNGQELTEAQFDRNFDLLLVFKEREGHVRVPIKHQESAADDLGTWLRFQKLRHRNGLLGLDRQKWLEVAGVTWES